MEKNIEIKDKKKVYTIFIVVIVALFVLAALGGVLAGRYMSDQNDDNPPAVSGGEQQPSDGVSANVGASDSVTPSADSSAPTAAGNVGGYEKGDYYVDNTGGKGLALRKEASSDSENLASIPAGEKLTVKEVVETANADNPYWASVTYDGKDGFVVMKYLTAAAIYEEQNEEPTRIVVGNYKAGTYTVDTGGYGIKVRDAIGDGDGDGLTLLLDGEEVVVLDVQKWDDAETDDYIYWGHIEWKGWDAYVPMYYLKSAE